MLPQEIIRKKRDGIALSADEIAALVDGIVDASLSDAQVGAFAMAVFLNGMTADETVALTRAMTASGRSLDWSHAGLPGPVLDKHSTGGVGDKVSLMLAPLIAACGGFVPMISGRGLGHTGGTLDKLDSIPDYDTAPDMERFQRVVAEVGCAIIGQTDDLAPADRRLYAVRDVTATVESIPLITASILSKKLAAGLDGLVMDVKTGNGAFAATMVMARELATSIVAIAGGAGLPATALITDMNQVLGTSAGNALEVRETVQYLTGDRRDPRQHEVIVALGSAMLVLGELAEDEAAGRQRLEQVLASSAAAEIFQRMVHAMGGAGDFITRFDRDLPRAPVTRAVPAPRAGVVSAMDTRALGLAVVGLGGGRRHPNDNVDPAVGLSEITALGTAVAEGDVLALVHARNEVSAENAVLEVQRSMQISDVCGDVSDVVIERIAKA